ncbi:Hydroxyproline-rich glycoprotein family protein [Quillaja saponaria]|uniref:Hydroxyproline-rich glycoprotein family protein n=1 Tax=Quillaja saponaria TaxID=32244 RepID=A0AAD7KVR2_QUISA|nr:Hydroxyproline-rich glycoprotein family protein [Quillaja saponaria]
MSAAAFCGLKPLLFRRKAYGLEATRGSDKAKKLPKAKKGGLGELMNCSLVGADHIILLMQLQKKILAFRDIMDLSPCDSSASINDLITKTLKDLHKLYPEAISRSELSEIKGTSIDQGLACFSRVLRSIGDKWMMNHDWLYKYGIPSYKENINTEKLVEIVLATLDCLIKVANEKFDMMDEDDQKKGYSPQADTFVKMIMGSPYSESSTSCCSSPATPTSVIPELMNYSAKAGESGKLSYASPNLWSLRVQAVGKLNPIDVKRLSFHMLPHTEAQMKKTCEESVRRMEVDTDLDVKKVDTVEEIRNSSAEMDTSEDLVFDLDETIIQKELDSRTVLSREPAIIPVTNVEPAISINPLQPPPVLQQNVPLPPPPPPPLPPFTQHSNTKAPEKLPTPPSPPPPPPIMQPNTAAVPSSTPSMVQPPPLPPPEFLTNAAAVGLPLPPPQPQLSRASGSVPPPPPPPPPPPLPQVSRSGPPTPSPFPKASGAVPLPPLPQVSRSVPPPPPPPLLGASGSVPPPPPPPLLGPSGSVPPPTVALKGSAPPPPMPLANGAAPPPPPGAGRSLRPKKTNTKLKRSTHIGNLYRTLKGKVEGTNLQSKSFNGRKGPIGANSGGKQGMADALAEITKRSAYFQQIEEDVQKYSKAINGLKPAISSFQTKDMPELLKFHKDVESILETLTDETQVLARFEGFPSKKLEAIRMAAALYSKLDSIVKELQNWKIVAPLGQLLDKVERYFDKIKRDMDALERTKDEEAKKFQNHNIHFDFQILIRIKEAMVDVSSSCMELALKEKRETNAAKKAEPGSKNDGKPKAKMLWRAFQFAFRVYTFAGGHDDRADNLTRELAQEIENDQHHD